MIDKRLKEWIVGVTRNNFTSVYPEILAFFCYNFQKRWIGRFILFLLKAGNAGARGGKKASCKTPAPGKGKIGGQGPGPGWR
jgi:hypothetical protein